MRDETEGDDVCGWRGDARGLWHSDAGINGRRWI
jgi:hypothetical protein